MRSLTPRQWTGIALAAVVLPVLTATVWPLITFLWELLPEGLLLWRVLLGVGLAALLLVILMRSFAEADRPHEFRLWPLITVAWTIAIGAVALMAFLVWFLLGGPGLDLPQELSPRDLDAIATRTFAVVAGLGGVALLVISYRRQRSTENGEQREITKLFNERFTAAYTQLGSEHAAVRLGAVQALAHLADDAPSEDEVQMIIDVLCAYLRMPYTPAPGPLPDGATAEETAEQRSRELEFSSLREVRHTIISIIGNHLREPTRWRGKNYDFTGVVFDGGNLTGAVFSGGRVSFLNAKLTDGGVIIALAEFSGGEVSFDKAEFSGGALAFIGARFSGGKVDFTEAKFSAGHVYFMGAKFISGTVDFIEAEFTGGNVSFSGAEFTGGNVSFSGAEFTGGNVSFSKTAFTDEAKFTSGNVSFLDASGTCPVGLLEAIERGTPGVVKSMPQGWQRTTNDNGDQEGPSAAADTP
jgi:uncharacterized protein YjbI with pentapeptide repeats